MQSDTQTLEPIENSPPRRALWRRILLPRFSLRTLLILTTLFSFTAAYIGNVFYQANQQRLAVELFTKINIFDYTYDYQFVPGTTSFTRDAVSKSQSSNVHPKILKLFGVDLFHNIVRVETGYPLYDSKDYLAAVHEMPSMPRLQGLSIFADSKQWLTEVSPAIHRLKLLKDLNLSFFLHELSAADAESLRNLTALNRLYIGGLTGNEIPIDISLMSFANLEELSLMVINLRLSGVERFPTLPKLKKIVIQSSTHNLSEEFFAALVKQCPALESVEFYGVIEPNVVRPLNDHAKLKSLKIFTGEKLQKHSSADYRAALTRIAIDYNDGK